MSFTHSVLSRRQLVVLGLGAATTLGLAACGATGGEENMGEGADVKNEQEVPEVDPKSFDALLAKGPVATDEVIASSTWATKIKGNGTLRVGSTDTSLFFSLLNLDDGERRGFDAGLFQLLTRYILGDETKYEFMQVTSSTRETLLAENTVDVVFATYSVTPERRQQVDFAGPYYVSQQSILVEQSNANIMDVEDLAGKKVAVQTGSTALGILNELVPDAEQQQFATDEEACLALEQGRVEAYVVDNTHNMGSIAKQPGKFKIVGAPFGAIDPYGVGIAKGSEDGVEFINDFLVKVEDAGLWAELWQVTIGDRIGSKDVPTPPAIGVFD